MLKQSRCWICAILATIHLACGQNPLIEHDHEHDHDHTHDVENHFTYHWHTEQGTYFQETEITLSQEQIAERFYKLHLDCWNGDEVVADEFFANVLVFKGKVIHITDPTPPSNKIIQFEVDIPNAKENEWFGVNIELEKDSLFVDSFKINTYYTLSMVVDRIGWNDGYTGGKWRFTHVDGKLAP